WAAAPLTRIAFAEGAPVAEPVGVSNYAELLSRCGDGLSPLIADPDGSIIDDLFGEGASGGLLGVGLSDCDPSDGLVEEHTMLVNFSTLPGPSAERNALALRIVTHELGHVIGLAHSVLNADFQDDGNAPNDVYLPIMFPVLSDDDPLGAAQLHLDDATMVASLYPAAGFAESTATIAGLTLLPPASHPISGTFLAVRSTADPLANAVFTASGLTPIAVAIGRVVAFLGLAGEPPGAFQVSGLPPGEYTVEVLGGMSGEQPEFYAAASESHDPAADPPDLAAPIALAAGEVARADLLLDAAAGTVAARASDTSWHVVWKGRARIPGDRQKVPASLLPPPGRLDLLATGGWALRSGSTLFDVLLSGRWAPSVGKRGASARRYEHEPAMPDVLTEFAESLFGTQAAFEELSATGRTNGKQLRGAITLRGRYFGGPRSTKLTLTYKYRGRPRGVDVVPGPVPPLATAAVVVEPALAETTPGGQVSFAAVVEGAPGGVTWSLTGPGSIDAAGVYRAPAGGGGRAYVAARSVSQPGAVGLAAVDVVP
ncbi:MAG TPA: hypothetical protein VNO26_00015, partial [Candidatus Limnocylindria bacterium]|nr:hypothetical protein [Candidatus Limnocylindria bacterium]